MNAIYIEDMLGIDKNYCWKIFILICIITFVVIIFKLNFRLMKKDITYKVFDGNGIVLNGEVYKKMSVFKKNELEHLQLHFPNINSYQNTVTIVLKEKIIGLPEGERHIIKIPFSNYAFMNSKSLKFTIINGNKAFFTDWSNIYTRFYMNGVEFETFGELKKIADKIVVKKQSEY